MNDTLSAGAAPHPHHETAPRLSLIRAIQVIAENAGEAGVTLREFLEALGERAFGAMLFVLALPCCIPFLYGVPQVVAVPMMAIAAQMAFGRHEPWLPGKLADRRIDKKGLERMAKGGRKFFGWLEVFAAPRLLFLSGPTAERFVGFILVIFCASILTPLPSTNTVPGIAVAIAAYGLMERDGLLVLIGLVLGALWVSLLGFIVVFAFEVLTAEDGGARAAISALVDMVRGAPAEPTP